MRADRVGSTAVPGLAAKPIVEIDLSVTNVEDESASLPHLLAAGHELRVHEPGHRLLRTPALHVHSTCATRAASGSTATWPSGTGCWPTSLTETPVPH